MDCINFSSIHLSWTLNSLHATHPEITFHPSIYLEGSKLSHFMDCINFSSIHLSWTLNSLHATHPEIAFHPSIYLEGSKLSHFMDCINLSSIHLSWTFNSLHATHPEIAFHPSILKAQSLVIWWIVLTSRLSIYVVTLLRWGRPNTHVSQSFAINCSPIALLWIVYPVRQVIETFYIQCISP
jgi:hypothetical protein